MRAVTVFPDRRELRVVDVSRPMVEGEHDVMVWVREVGIRGTDRESCDFGYGTPVRGGRRCTRFEGLGTAGLACKTAHARRAREGSLPSLIGTHLGRAAYGWSSYIAERGKD